MVTIFEKFNNAEDLFSNTKNNEISDITLYRMERSDHEVNWDMNRILNSTQLKFYINGKNKIDLKRYYKN